MLANICLMAKDITEEIGAAPWLKGLLAFVVGVACGTLEDVAPAGHALMLLMFADYALGTAEALKRDVFRFSRFWRGFGKFLLYGVAVLISEWLDVATGAPFHVPAIGLVGFEGSLLTVLAVNEGLSAFTHLETFGLKVPWLTERLKRVKNYVESEAYTGPERRKNPEARVAVQPSDIGGV
jgi:phage-related holin